jgi:hypothetical protein
MAVHDSGSRENPGKIEVLVQARLWLGEVEIFGEFGGLAVFQNHER